MGIATKCVIFLYISHTFSVQYEIYLGIHASPLVLDVEVEYVIFVTHG